MLPTEVRARRDLRHRLQSRGGRRRGSARLGGSLGLPRLLASVPQAEWRGFFQNAGRLGNPRSGVMRRAKEWSGVGGFLEKQGPLPRDGRWPPSGQERRPCGKCSGGGHYGSSGPSVTLRLLRLGGASEELRGDKPREARAALGGAWLVWSEGGARRAGERQGTRKMLKMALGLGGTEGREETVAAMTAASGCARPAPGPSPHPPSPFWIIPMPVKTGSPEASFFVFCIV